MQNFCHIIWILYLYSDVIFTSSIFQGERLVAKYNQKWNHVFVATQYKKVVESQNSLYCDIVYCIVAMKSFLKLQKTTIYKIINHDG